ncbi:hypothetical protein PHYSODRAFT_337391 [Phytophthora sojae]|uniref:Prolyl 4-hydroxylase alpha subunit Fe(2+) 2OG dioxygenase domain-containing protein n=1 Tax=Phytophthora sojae (strain P6497) TaxID=1094619 RepID=G5A0X3_PHYSP|nr:hypothetical protein PHYSODRAFT_337391 [Phytophthora sojae]EGZ10605.1 hypothetical protein PHYSODRAFT_337391 [Phytophthora sojae]|eukprot:XP_009533350.1 hypothetical protein PHYSODRAFT_337391 [Phytophthora sojae]
MSLDEDFADNKWPFPFKDVLKPKGAGCAQVSKVLARGDEHAGEYSFGGLADTLPAVSGLFVGSVGTIHTPLVADQAEKLVALCQKSPFVHNLDTKMDENVLGMDKLRKVIADRLGYTDVPLDCVLYKLLGTEKDDGMIATLVVQPPSAHEGGDLVVYRDGKLTYRHDFGKADGSAAFATHYAVHYADAEHALEEVTKGFRLALVYSICLPATMRHLKRTEDKQLSEDLAQAISSVGSEKEKKKNEEEGDADQTSGEQRANVKDAKEDKKVKVKDDQGEGNKREEDDGDTDSDEDYVDDENNDDDDDDSEDDEDDSDEDESDYDEDDSFALLLEREYTTKSIQTLGSGALKDIDCARFHALEEANARVAPEKKLCFFIAQLTHDGEDLGHKPVTGEEIRALFDTTAARLEAENRYKEFWEEEATVVWSMNLREVGMELWFPPITKILCSYGWDEVSQAVLKALGRSDESGKGGLSALELILRVFDSLDGGAAQQALVDKTLQLTTSTKDEDLFLSSYIGLLWKVAIDYADKTLFDTVVNRLKNADPGLLGPSIQYLSQYVDSVDGNDEKTAVVTIVTPKRIKWLREQVESLEKPFSWEMREAEFPGNDEIQSFLRGAEVSMEMKGAEKKFKNFEDAKEFAAKWMNEKQTKFLFEMEGHETFVTITKTRDWYLKQQSNLVLYRKELRRLMDRYDNSNGDEGEKKRTRLD